MSLVVPAVLSRSWTQVSPTVYGLGRRTQGRRDIQGLRAFAVIAVVLDHLVEWPPGGFIGVDVFFVISGFLITGILIREHERTGRVSFLAFYRRRIKRIVPAATLVISSTVVAAYFLFNTSRFSTTVGDAIWALLFASNWRFATQSTDYFAQSIPVSPLQQFWSLGVEEQFYVFWPCVMVVSFGILGRRRRSSRQTRAAVGGVLAVLTALSFAWAVRETATVPDQAYFSTFSRAWELGVGALLAVAVPLLLRLPAVARPFLAWTGLLGLTASLWLITPDRAFPAPSAALPVLATALIVAAGTGVPQQRFLAPLTNRVAGYVGDISYSLYLWHFPFVVFGTGLWGRAPWVLTGLGVSLLVASIYSFHLVEDPVRRSGWLEGHRDRPRREFGAPRLSRGQSQAWSSLAVILSILMLVALQRSVPQYPLLREGVSVAAPEDSAKLSAGQSLQVQIRQALGATSYPALSPTMNDTVGAQQAPDEILQCGTSPVVDQAACSFGPLDAERTAVVVGDSMSMTYVGSLRVALDDWRVISLGGFGCTFTERLIGNSDPELESACPDRKQAAVETINRLKPDLVLISNTHYPRVPVGASVPLTEAQWSESTLALVEKFAGAADKVVFLAPPPAQKDVNQCYSRVSEPAACVSEVTSEWEQRAATERDMAASLGGVWVDSARWFCDDGRCPPFVGTTPVKVDVNHMTVEYAEKIAPVVRESLAADGLL